MSLVVETQNLEKSYMLGEISVHALRGVNFSVQEGDFVSILGPSGSGKSTLLNMIGALDIPTKGKVLIDGKNTANMKQNELAIYRRKVGFVFQFYNLIPRLNAVENVEISLSIQGISKQKRREQALKILDMVGLKNRTEHKPYELSGGQQQRVAIARALARDPIPKYLLMDEPTGNVDTKTRDELMELIKKLNKNKGLTVILITHDPYVAEIADRTVYIIDGQIFGSESEYKKRLLSEGPTNEIQ